VFSRRAPAIFYLLIIDFSLGGIAERKRANKQGRAAKFYLLNFARDPAN
jgi:hypothetical protein